LPLDYYARLPGQLTHVRPNAIEQAAKRYLDPASMVVVAVGERASIEAPLEANGMKPVQTFAPADLF
jgi:zinc protease